MAAITRDGKIAWQRNLFDDPKLQTSMPPPGEKPMSDDQAQRWMRAYWERESVDRIGVLSDCETQIVDRQYPKFFRGHYVIAGSGTHILYLLDAKTGDFLVEQVN